MHKQFYEKNGYLIIEKLFDGVEIKKAHDAVAEIITSTDKLEDIAELEKDDKNSIRRFWSPTKRHPYFLEMIKSPKMLDVVEQLIGHNILYHYSKLNMKAPKIGSVVEWHQDFSYYPHTNTDLVSCLVYLDDATVENACLQVIPGSHKFGLFDHNVDGYFRGKILPENMQSLQNQAISLSAPAGSVIFIHCLMLHYSPINTSNMQRRVFIPAYRAADAYPIYFGPHAAHNENGIMLMRGQQSKIARVEAGSWQLPFAEKSFNSLFQLQEGSHLENQHNNIGYYANV